jgi:hypothetical protein
MKTVWAIEDGNYSDYHVIGVFTSKENAELIRAKTGGTIDEWPLNPAVDELSKGYTSWYGDMLFDGTTTRMEQQSDLSGYNLSNSLHIWKCSKVPFYKGKDVQDCISGHVLAKDSKHAVKIFNEFRTQQIASGKFQPPKVG